METVTGQPIKKFNFFFEFSRVSSCALPLTKKPEDSGYETDQGFEYCCARGTYDPTAGQNIIGSGNEDARYGSDFMCMRSCKKHKIKEP